MCKHFLFALGSSRWSQGNGKKAVETKRRNYERKEKLPEKVVVGDFMNYVLKLNKLMDIEKYFQRQNVRFF